MTVCERIDEILKVKKMSRRQLAIEVGIAPSSFQSAMQRNTTLSLDMLFPIADYLKISVEYLLGEEVTPFPPDSYLDKMAAENDQNPAHKKPSILSEIKILALFEQLNREGQKTALERMEELTQLSKYNRTDPTETPLDGVLYPEGYTDTTEKEKPPEGENKPNDGK